MRDDQKPIVDSPGQADGSDTERVMDSVDRVTGAVLGTHRSLSEKQFDADIAMEQQENTGIWNDPNLSTEEKVLLSQKNHASHNEQRIKAQNETLSASTDSIVKINSNTGKIATLLKIAGSSAAGSLLFGAAGAAAGLEKKDIAKLAIAGAALGTGIGATVFDNEEETAPIAN